MNQAEHYLEAAIVMAPHTTVSADACALLEEQILFGYSGSAGLSLPEEVRKELERLRTLAM